MHVLLIENAVKSFPVQSRYKHDKTYELRKRMALFLSANQAGQSHIKSLQSSELDMSVRSLAHLSGSRSVYSETLILNNKPPASSHESAIKHRLQTEPSSRKGYSVILVGCSYPLFMKWIRYTHQRINKTLLTFFFH